MKKIFVVSAGFLLGLHAAFAGDFAGHWVGTGRMTGVGMNDDCSKIEIVMEQSSGQLITRSYHSVCGMADSSWGPDTMDLQGAKVFDQGDEIGTLTSDTLTTDQAEGSVVYTFDLKLQPAGPSGKRSVHSVYAVKNDVGSVVIEGDLQEQ